jgi:hypothetical protein
VAQRDRAEGVGVSRGKALALAAGVIARSVPDLGFLCDLLEMAGQRRLVGAIEKRLAAREAEVGGRPRPDPGVWSKGRVR